MKLINVSIVTYMSSVNDVLKSIATCSKSPLVKNIFIIDNSPNDELCDTVVNWQKVKYIHNPKNPGYGASHNIAINNSLSNNISYHLVINADVIFDFNLLEQMVSYLDCNEDTGLVAPKMLYVDGSVQCSRKLLPTPINMFFRAFFPKSLRTYLDYQLQLEYFGYEDTIIVPYVSGAFMFLRTSVLNEVGVFDERFFMYPEDIDLSRRIAEVSQVRFVPHFVITHKYGGATWKSLRMFTIHAWNMCRYFNKWGWFFDKGRKDLNKRTLEQKPLSKLAENL